MTKVAYPAIFLHPDETGGLWGVVFPDLPGTTSTGTSLAHATMEAVEALDMALAALEEDGTPLPAPSGLTTARHLYLDDEDATEDDIAAVQLVVGTLPGKTQRYTITLDPNLVARIDRVSTNRSAFLADAARAELRRRQDMV